MEGLLLVATMEGTVLKGDKIWPQQLGTKLEESRSCLDKAGWQNGVYEDWTLHLSPGSHWAEPGKR